MERQGEKKKERHSCFEWIQLFISILIPVAIGVYTVLENNRDIAIAMENRRQDLEIVDNEQKDRVLHECQKIITKLIERYGRTLNGSSAASLVARFATLSAVNQLDSVRRSFLIRLLYESQLIIQRSENETVPVSLESANLTDLDLRDPAQQRPLLFISLQECLLLRANFQSMTLYGGKFIRSILIKANFEQTRNSLHFDPLSLEEQLNKTPELQFDFANLENASFVDAVYRNATFQQASMRFVDFERFFCQDCQFLSSEMTLSNFRRVTIEKSLLAFSSMNNANLYESHFGPDVDFFSSTLIGINAAHSTLIDCHFDQSRSQNATYDYSSIINSTFHNAQLTGISIQQSIVKNCDFTKADLRYSQWLGTTCEDCLFDGVDFTGANLSGSNFTNSNFKNSTITVHQLKSSASLNFVLLPDGTMINHP